MLLKDVNIELSEMHGREGKPDRRSFSRVFEGSLSVSGKGGEGKEARTMGEEGRVKAAVGFVRHFYGVYCLVRELEY